MDKMESILRKLNMLDYLPKFMEEKISPDIVYKLKKNDWNIIGITNSADIMRIRVECICHGQDRGKTKYVLTKDMINVLLESGFTVKDMGKMLGVSERTLHRRMSTFDIKVHSFTDIDDSVLDQELKDAVSAFPRCGEVMLRQIIQSKGIRVKRSRLRERLHVIDHEGVKERQKKRLHRRVYEVSAPNYIWHVDTNHKLIRWKLVIAGGVDGFSRFVVYLKCLDNNRANTLCHCFLEAVQKYGHPLNVRSDQGMENLEIAEYMLMNGRNMITGKSTQNQRIERLWRDIYEGVLSSFYTLFYSMEDAGILDPLDECHVFSLHFVFIPNINQKLNIWNVAWSSHRIRTINSSPRRLFLAGAINTDFNQQTDAPTDITFDTRNNHVMQTNQRPVIEQSLFALSPQCRQELEQVCQQNNRDFINPHSGIPIFNRVLEIVTRHRQSI